MDEYKLEAAFALSLSKFVEWPHSEEGTGHHTFRLGILGVDPFGEAIDEVVGGKSVRGAPVEIVRGRRLSDVGGCDVLFIAVSEEPRLAQHLAGLSGMPVLTVSDLPGFVEIGGMIGLCTEDNRICFEVNRQALEQAGLEASSRLLTLARDVIGAHSNADYPGEEGTE